MGTYAKTPRESIPAGRELIRKLQSLKPPRSAPSYAEIAEATKLSIGTVHSTLRKGEFSRTSFDTIARLLAYFNEPVVEYERLWDEVRLLTVDALPSDPAIQLDPAKVEALRNAALIYQGSTFPKEAILDMADAFEEWLRGEYDENVS